MTYLNCEGGGNSYGDAILTGIRRARGEFILFSDADGSHPPKFICNLWSSAAYSDVVIASRYVAGGATDNARALILMSLLVNIIYALVRDRSEFEFGY